MAWLVVFVVVRRMALLGDAVSHGILPGIVTAYLITDSFVNWTGLDWCLSSRIRVWSIYRMASNQKLLYGRMQLWDLPSLPFFALGIVLLSLEAGATHLDPACFLYGEIGLTPLSPKLELWGLPSGNQALWNMGVVCLTTMISVIVFYRFLLVTSFDCSPCPVLRACP